jgi:sugar phosphate isomerase/epimerase
MNPLGLEYLTVMGCHPLDYVRIAANIGCSHIAFHTKALDFPGMPPPAPSIFEDARLRKEVTSSIRDHGLSVHLVDGFGFHPRDPDPDYRALLDMAAEIGAAQISSGIAIEMDAGIERIAALADQAAGYGLTVLIEGIPTYTVGTLPEALHVVTSAGKPNLKLLIDTMHTARTGGAGLLATIDPALIGHIQICDGPAGMPAGPVYFDQALYQREIPGQGELPLVEMIASMPAHLVAGMEIPLRSLREAGVSDAERARRAAEGSRKVLEAAERARLAKV